MTKVFVYGSLREGCKAHDLLAKAKKIADARLLGYDLYRVAWYPGIKLNPDNKDGVVGEIYEVDKNTLDMLDCYEGVAEGLFVRQEVEAVGPAGFLNTQVYAYNRSTDFKFCERIPSGDWKKCD